MNELDQIFIQASKAFDEEDYKKAFQLYNVLADKKYTFAYNNLAVLYECALGTEKSIVAALYWYKKAWSTDKSVSASKNIADLYWKIGNIRQAVFWWKKSMLQGDGEAALAYAEALISKGNKKRQLIIELLKIAAQDSNLTLDSREKITHLLSTSLYK